MSLITETEPLAQAQIVRRRGFQSDDELDMRAATDRWARARWPEARQVHELVMNRGSVRADMAIAAELKANAPVPGSVITQAQTDRHLAIASALEAAAAAADALVTPATSPPAP